MNKATLYYATNRRHQGEDQWNPVSYDIEPSKDGAENLRFGKVTLTYDENEVSSHLTRDCGFGTGDGLGLADYLLSQSGSATIQAFEETLDKRRNDIRQSKSRFGSTQAFSELQQAMTDGNDIVVFVHGFNVSWWEAVASALSLEFLLNSNAVNNEQDNQVRVVLFSWPSDGKAIPMFSYFSDRGDGKSSGAAVGRGFLKLRDYLAEVRQDSRSNGEDLCDHSLHLLCHSMGNYVLQHALLRTEEFSARGKLPRIFDQIFLCAPDVSDDVFEHDRPMRHLAEMAQNVTIYHNKGDLAMSVSDYTKGNTDRLGWRGVSRPSDLDGRVHQVDCSPIVTGVIEHSYYQCGLVNEDIRKSISGISQDSESRAREPLRHGWPNVWRFPGQGENP